MERMETIPIPSDLKEACLCKGFGATLTGPALKWLLALPNCSISSFANLVNAFNLQFSCSKTFEKITGDLYKIKQRSDESLKDYMNRFTKESLEITKLDMTTAVEALKSGLMKDTLFYRELVMNPGRDLDDVRNRAIRFIRLEEDEALRRRSDTTSYDRPNRKAEYPVFKPNKNKPYTRPTHQRINAVDQEETDIHYPTIEEYCFSVGTLGVVCALKDLGDKVRWPSKNKTVAFKDKSKWCAYHEDFGHVTDECIALRKEIAVLLSQGHLTELFGRKKARDYNPAAKIPEDQQKRPKSPPVNARVINYIAGGSEVCGTSYSAAKRNAKEAKLERGDKPQRTSSILDTQIISFENEDLETIQDPHQDSLVVSLHVANHLVRRILIDNGSSVNIIKLDTLERMGIPKEEIAGTSTILVGFSGEIKNTVGEIKLPVYVEGANSIQKFCVVDSLPGCNIILGRPWIHDLKAVPSTYHQCIKLPTPWGVVKIRGDQLDAKECYMASMKPAAKSTSA
jgi:hypothetical protein